MRKILQEKEFPDFWTFEILLVFFLYFTCISEFRSITVDLFDARRPIMLSVKQLLSENGYTFEISTQTFFNRKNTVRYYWLLLFFYYSPWGPSFLLRSWGLWCISPLAHLVHPAQLGHDMKEHRVHGVVGIRPHRGELRRRGWDVEGAWRAGGVNRRFSSVRKPCVGISDAATTGCGQRGWLETRRKPNRPRGLRLWKCRWKKDQQARWGKHVCGLTYAWVSLFSSKKKHF